MVRANDSTVPAGSARRRLSAGVDEAVRLTAAHLPDGVKRRLSAPYNRFKVVEADSTFRNRALTVRTPAPDAPDHVVVVVVDALRADSVDPATCPFIEERSLGAAITPAPWTFPAVSSLLVGRYPHEHGAMRRSDEAERTSTDLVIPSRLPADDETLSEVFAGAGYRTYGGFAFHMPFFALGGRFEHHALYDDADAGTLLADAAAWLEARREATTFSYLHLGDLHEPVDPPERYWTAVDVDASIPNLRRWDYVDAIDPGSDGERYRRHRERLYRGALSYVDDQLCQFHERLTERVDGDVALLVTADHGEGFWDHAAFDADHFVDSRPAYCVDHGGTPYEAITRVPLAVDGLDLHPVDSVAAPASLVDIAPTLLDVIGLPDTLPTSGHPLTSPIPPERIPLVEASRYGYEKKAAYADGWKLLVSRRDDVSVGFALPEEEPTELPVDVDRRLAAALPAWPDGDGADVRVSGLARDRLEDLGYV